MNRGGVGGKRKLQSAAGMRGQYEQTLQGDINCGDAPRKHKLTRCSSASPGVMNLADAPEGHKLSRRPGGS